MKTLGTVSLVLVVIGALNWGLVGIFDFNLVSYLFGFSEAFVNIVYILVALAGLYIAFYDVKRDYADNPRTV